jgi:hypothetical protein
MSITKLLITYISNNLKLLILSLKVIKIHKIYRFMNLSE